MYFLLFEAAGHRYGVPAATVVEVVRAVALAPLPGAARAVEGVFSLRGELVPVIDVRTRFGLESRALDPDQHFVIVRLPSRMVALRVDQALMLTDVAPEKIQDATRSVPSARHVQGVATLDDGLVVIYDLDAFLTQAEAEAMTPALTALAASPA